MGRIFLAIENYPGRALRWKPGMRCDRPTAVSAHRNTPNLGISETALPRSIAVRSDLERPSFCNFSRFGAIEPMNGESVPSRMCEVGTYDRRAAMVIASAELEIS